MQSLQLAAKTEAKTSRPGPQSKPNEIGMFAFGRVRVLLLLLLLPLSLAQPETIPGYGQGPPTLL